MKQDYVILLSVSIFALLKNMKSSFINKTSVVKFMKYPNPNRRNSIHILLRFRTFLDLDFSFGQNIWNGPWA